MTFLPPLPNHIAGLPPYVSLFDFLGVLEAGLSDPE